MPVRLTAYLGSGPCRWKIFGQGEYVLGRSPSAAFVLSDACVSREHVKLVGDDAGWRVIDLLSKNGTRLDGRPISVASLSHDSWLSLGDAHVRVEKLTDELIAGAAAAETDKRRAGAAATRRTREGATISAVLSACLDGVLELGGCARASLWLSNEQRELALQLRRGEETPPESETALRSAIESGELILANDIEGVAGLAQRESVLAGGIRAIICLPLMIGGAVRGVLYADSKQVGKAFSELDVELLQSLAEQTSLALAAAQLRVEITRGSAEAE